MFIFRRISIGITTLAVLVSVLAWPVTASAQATTQRPPLSLTTSPLPLSVVTQPGKTVTADIRVKNNGTQAEKLKVELLKFHADGVSGDPQLQERGPQDDYFDWVSFSEKQFVGEPNVWKTIKITIKAPPDAAFGYYLAVLFSRADPGKPTGGASAVEGGVASLVLLDVEAPGAKRELKIAHLTASRKVYEFLPADMTIKLDNVGNIHVAPVGDIRIKHGGKEVGVLRFNDQQGNILPGSSRTFQTSWNDGFPAYETKVDGTKTTKKLKWDFGKLQKFRFGRYTASLYAVYNDGQRDIPVEGTVSFWVIPWRILGVVLLVLLLVGAGIYMILRSLWKGVRRSRGHGGKRTADDSADTDAAGSAGDKGTGDTSKGLSKNDTAAETSAPGADAMVVSEVSDEEAATETVPDVPAKLQATQKPATAPTRKRRASAVKKLPRSSDSSTDEPKTAPVLKD